MERLLNGGLLMQENVPNDGIRFSHEMKQSLLGVLRKAKILNIIGCVVMIPTTIAMILGCFYLIATGNESLSFTDIVVKFIGIVVNWYCICGIFKMVRFGRKSCFNNDESAMVAMFKSWDKMFNAAFCGLALLLVIKGIELIIGVLGN